MNGSKENEGHASMSLVKCCRISAILQRIWKSPQLIAKALKQINFKDKKWRLLQAETSE